MNSELLDFSLSFHPCRVIPSLDIVHGLFENAPRFSEEFREIAAAYHSVPSNMVLPLSGACEGISLLSHRFRKPAGIFPLFADYSEAFFRDQIGITKFTTLPEERLDADLFIIVNPQNPTGTYFEPSVIQRFARRNPQLTVLVDETFLEMGDSCRSLISVDLVPNIVVLRSITESSGWPSLRAGYFVSSPRAISELKRWVLPWQISALDMQLIRWYFVHLQEFRDSWEIQRHLKKDLANRLRAVGCSVVDSPAPFLLFSLQQDRDLRNSLLQNYSILVRDCRSYNLVGWYRVTPRSEPENGRLAAAIGEIIRG